MKWRYLTSIFFASGALVFADDPPGYDANPDLINMEGYVVFFNGQGPMSYAAATPHDVPADAIQMGRVHAKSCQHGVSFPLSVNLAEKSAKISGALGNSGFTKIFKKLRETYPGIEGVYDIQVDRHEIRILTIYSTLCTELTGRGFRRS